MTTKKELSPEAIKAREELKALSMKRKADKAEAARKAQEAAAKAAKELEARKAVEQEVQERAAKNEAIIKAAKAKEEQEAAKLKEGFDKKEQAARKEITGINEATQEEIDKAIIKLKTLYDNAGTRAEIGPNLCDIQYNTWEGITPLWNTIHEKGLHKYNTKTKRDTIEDYKRNERNKLNGNIIIRSFKPEGHKENNFIIFLLPARKMTIEILEGVKYPSRKRKAKEAGIDNREYTFHQMTKIDIDETMAIPMAMVTNQAKAVGYAMKYSQFYKVDFNDREYNKQYIQEHKYDKDYYDFSGTLEPYHNNRKGELTGDKKTFSDWVDSRKIINWLPYLTAGNE